MKKNFFSFLILNFFFLSGCTTVQHISKSNVEFVTIGSTGTTAEKESVTLTIAPYKAQLDAEMNEVIGTISSEISKHKPESALGNLVADVMLDRMIREGFDPDLAIVNYGGLRVPYLAPGPLTVGEIFELSPFDNLIHVLEVPGDVLDSALMAIATFEGWPVSRGLKMVISNKAITSVSLHGMPIDPNKTYKVATLDYVANGGDDMSMFIPLKRQQTRFLLRDILIDHVRALTAGGQTLSATTDGRIVLQ